MDDIRLNIFVAQISANIIITDYNSQVGDYLSFFAFVLLFHCLVNIFQISDPFILIPTLILFQKGVEIS